MNEQRFPPGWDERRVQEVLAHYEGQTEDEQFAEIEAGLEAKDITVMAVPTILVPEIRSACTVGIRLTPNQQRTLVKAWHEHVGT